MAYRIGQVIMQCPTTAYSVENGNYIISGNYKEAMEEITSSYGVQRLSHIGIQGRPGSFFALDDEIIIIGRSGSYELSNDLVSISSIKLLSQGTYIIDFRY